MCLPPSVLSHMEIHVIRHTQVAVGKDTCYGQTDVPLADSFSKEVQQFKKQLPSDFDAVYCSPLERCKDLAKALRLNNTLFENALMEMHFGNWENKKWNDINQDELDAWMADFVHVSTPNGENLLQLFERAERFLNALRTRSHKKVLIITHAGIIRCFWASLLDIPLQNVFKIPIGHNEIFVFSLSASQNTDKILKPY